MELRICGRSGLNNGLSSEAAKQKLETEGFNEFQKKAHTSLIVKFLSQFKSFMIIVLIVAALISGVVGYLNGEGFTDAIIIFVNICYYRFKELLWKNYIL